MTTLPAPSGSSQQASIDAALLVLKSMGLSLDDLTSAPRNRPPVPTFAEYVPVVSATLTPATLRAYGSYGSESSSSGETGTWTSRRLRRSSSSWSTSRRTRCSAATVGLDGHDAVGAPVED
jgi:hypothetical protein